MDEQHRDIMDDIMDIIRLMGQPDIEADPLYVQAKQFKESFKPNEDFDDVGYDWVWDYAENAFKRTEQIYKELDDKANDIIKYLGGGTGLFTLAVLANIKAESAWVIVAAIPSFVLAVVSIALAARARGPNTAYQPPSIETTFDYVGHFKDGTKARVAFLGQWHLACVAMDLAIEVKGARVVMATRLFVWAIAALSLPVAAAIAC